MRLLFVTLSFCAAFTVPSSIPKKLQLYQNVTGINDAKLFDILNNSKEGEYKKTNEFDNDDWGQYENTFPKFRFTGTIPSGSIHPVEFTTEELNVDAVINGGVFLCMRPGYYHFTVAMSAYHSGRKIDVFIVRNSRDIVFAAWVFLSRCLRYFGPRARTVEERTSAVQFSVEPCSFCVS